MRLKEKILSNAFISNDINQINFLIEYVIQLKLTISIYSTTVGKKSIV